LRIEDPYLIFLSSTALSGAARLVLVLGAKARCSIVVALFTEVLALPLSTNLPLGVEQMQVS
jgi:hypothetical protein